MDQLTFMEALQRIGLAALMAATIGLDREWLGKAAGLRTNALVGAAAALFGLVSLEVFDGVTGADPSRVGSEVVSGVGFLGAGAVFAMGGRPRGLTTAAALWASAAIGLAVGFDRAGYAAAITVVALVLLVVGRLLERATFGGRRGTVRDVYVVVEDSTALSSVQRAMSTDDVRIRSMELQELHDQIGTDLVLEGPTTAIDQTLATLDTIPGVVFASDERGRRAGSPA